MNIVSFSGGKDSTAMLLLMIEKKMKIDEVVFFDTGWEFPQMYEHIALVEKNTGIKITHLHPPKSFDYYMFDHVKTKGKRKGEVGYSWADFRNRWCTAIKVQTINKYLSKKDNPIQFVGIAFDEQHRKIDKTKQYPLIEFQHTELMALELCYSRGYTFGGLYKKFDRVSCYNCPLKSMRELKILHDFYPDLWGKMQEMDDRTYRQFRSEYSIKQLTNRFITENKNYRVEDFINYIEGE